MSPPVRSVAVVGASRDRAKFGNKAVRAFARQGFHVYPINPHETEIEGWPAYASVLDVPATPDMATLYVPPSVGEAIVAELARKGVREVWFNPGSESPAAVAGATALGLTPLVACSILGIGESPAAF
jgi:hypothetical protein